MQTSATKKIQSKITSILISLHHLLCGDQICPNPNETDLNHF